MSRSMVFAIRNVFALAPLLSAVYLSAQSPDSTQKKNVDSVYVPTANELSRFRMKHAEAVMHKPTWHIGILAGFHFEQFNYTPEQTTYSKTTRDDVITDSNTTTVPVYKANRGIGLKFGLVCH